MKSLIVRLNGMMTVAVLLLVCIDMSGCSVAAVAIHNSDVKKFPSYTETERNWGEIPDGMGRVVIMYPKESSVGKVVFNALTNAVFQIDGIKNKANLQDQNFVFIDLPEGMHSFHIRYRISGKNKAEFDVKRGEVIYVTVDHLKIMNRQEAEPFLAEVHHLFQLPLPYDKQDKKARRQKW